jgi:uncharacterized membrane protein (UPF0127 family)
MKQVTSLGHSLRQASPKTPLRVLVGLPRPGTALRQAAGHGVQGRSPCRAKRVIPAKAGIAFFLCFLATTAQALPQHSLTLTSPDGTIQKNLTVEIAADAESRRIGLMYRKSMKPDAGMLFTYPARGQIGMWMRNTFIPLDMIFIRGNEVVGIHRGAVPHDETVIRSPEDVDAVLELNAGYVNKHFITTGWRVSY